MSKINNSLLNDVKKRFLSLPKSAVEGLEHEPKKSDFNFIKELGVGSFGTVYLVSHKKTKAKYALKAIDKTVPENIAEKKIFNREVEIMYKLSHPNIVKLYGHFEDEKYCYFIMQFIPNRTLFDLIPEEGKKPNVKQIVSVMKDLLCAVYYLHNMKPTIIHRDIKPENILLDQNSKAYLTDFGWSNYMSNFIRRNTVCGTPLYLPPEMVEQLGHDETADIWCIGVLLFELISGTTPFKGNDIDTVTYNIRTLKITWPKKMDPDAQDLISKILKLEGKDRLSIEQILNHKFFKKYFPNASKDLIKPDNQKIRTFIVSKDEPKIWENETKPTPNREQNTKTSSYISINNNKKNNINQSYNYKANDNKQNKRIIIRDTYVPRANIDLSNKRNNNQISIANSNNSRYTSNIRNASNSYDKNNKINRLQSFNSSNKNTAITSSYNNNKSNYRNNYTHTINNNHSNLTNNNKSNINNNVKYMYHQRLNCNPQYSSTVNNNNKSNINNNTKYMDHQRLNSNPLYTSTVNNSKYIIQNKNIDTTYKSNNNRRSYRPETMVHYYSSYNLNKKKI